MPLGKALLSVIFKGEREEEEREGEGEGGRERENPYIMELLQASYPRPS